MMENVDVIELILQQLDPLSFYRSRQVCKLWRDVANKPTALWSHVTDKIIADADDLEAGTFRENLEAIYPGIESDSSKLQQIYLDLVRYSFVVYDITVEKLQALDSPKENQTRLLSEDGTILLTTTPTSGGILEIELFDVIKGTKELYFYESRRAIELVRLSQDNKFVAMSSGYGYLEVIKLERPTCTVIYSRQYPSHFESLAVSAGGEVFMGKSIRLGGYSVVNLDTGEEMDIGHYRLDLSLRSMFDDLVLILPGRGETFIYGWTSETPITRERGQLWRYYEYLIKNDIFHYITRADAVPLVYHRGYFLSILRDEEGGPDQLALVHEEYKEPVGFKSIEEFAHKRKASSDTVGGEDSLNSGEESGGEEEEERESNVRHDDDEDDEEDDEDESEDVALSTMDSDSSYTLSTDATRVALLNNGYVHFYAFRHCLSEMYGKWSYCPYRRVLLPPGDYANAQLKMIDTDRLVILTKNTLLVLSLSLTP